MNIQPLISIGIPTYNRPNGLRNLLSQVTKQTYTNLEIIVSDNCSANAEVDAVMLEFSTKDPRVKTFKQKENIGLAKNFQFVLSESTGEFFTWVSDDDLIEHNYIESTYNAIKDAPGYNLVMGRIALYSDEGDFIKYIEATRSIENSKPEERVYSYFKNIQISGYFYGLYRASTLKEIGYIHKMLGADILVSIYVIFSGKVKVINDTAYKYFVGGSSVDHERLARVVGLTQIHASFFGFYDTYRVIRTILKYKLFKTISFSRRIVFCFKCSWLMLRYTRAIRSSFIVIKRKTLRLILGRQTLRPPKN